MPKWNGGLIDRREWASPGVAGGMMAIAGELADALESAAATLNIITRISPSGAPMARATLEEIDYRES